MQSTTSKGIEFSILIFGCGNGRPQYTSEMNPLLHILDRILVWMFVVGGIGSAFVIAISFVEDMHELFTKDE